MNKSIVLKPSTIVGWTKEIKSAMVYTVKDLKRSMQISPDDYTEYGAEEPSIDVRLCIDEDGWIIRVGSVDYDPYHSLICAAGSVGLETDSDELAQDLIEDSLDQLAERLSYE